MAGQLVDWKYYHNITIEVSYAMINLQEYSLYFPDYLLLPSIPPFWPLDLSFSYPPPSPKLFGLSFISPEKKNLISLENILNPSIE